MTRFTIPDMDCASCVKAITRVVQGRDPAAKLSADLAAHTIQIDSLLDAATLAGLIDDAGFTATKA
jgi:copper chaperone